ncbi:AAA family ATPase [Candidatus Palauibacter sp.]|uniref:AAA family ATPase n=1 Tax=Candidatus Palauibacter sp. TaxID=3101350 RepID=UPI003B02A8EB
MRVTLLTLVNVRAIGVAEFRFQPGFNLVVGENGVGKTSVLHALRVSLSAVVKHANTHRSAVWNFASDDIRVGANALTVECSTRLGGAEYRYLIHKPREESAIRAEKAGSPREQMHETPGRAGFLGESPMRMGGREGEGRPLAVLFSTLRSRLHARAPSKRAAAGGPAAAFADALSRRAFRFGELAAWMRSQEALRPTHASAGRALAAFETAVSRFLPGYSNLRPHGTEEHDLLIDRDRSSLAVRHMSSGERGVLALVLDLTRRLVQANPDMADPIAESEAVVLIDELELHLHPKWQRQIVRKLEKTFPRCQFIATTHSPQIIGEVPHDRIQIMTDRVVYSPTHAFGVDSSRVLEEIMDASPRNQEVEELLAKTSGEIGGQRYELARKSLAKLAGRLGENDPEVTRIRTLLDFVEGDD